MTHPTVAPAPAPAPASRPTPCRSTAVVVGLDVGDRRTHFCALAEDRTVVARGSFPTDLGGLTTTLARFASGTRVILEAGSQSRWMSRHTRELGYLEHVVDPRRVASVSRSNRKTDERDAELLARLALGMPELLGRIDHRSEADQAVTAIIRVRHAMISARTQLVLCARGLVKTTGMRLPDCSPEAFPSKCKDKLPADLVPALDPVLQQIAELTKTIKEHTKLIEANARKLHPKVDALRAVPGVGPLVASTFVVTVSTPERFQKSRQVGAWLGLVPKVHASGDRDPQMGISKTGCPYMRQLLVQSAHYVLSRGPDSELRRFGLKLCERGGKAARRRAVVAVARKLAVLLHRLWVSDEPYQAFYRSTPA